MWEFIFLFFSPNYSHLLPFSRSEENVIKSGKRETESEPAITVSSY